jgi:hypothetical protein
MRRVVVCWAVLLLLPGCAGLKWSLGYNPLTRQWTVSGELPSPGSYKK